MSISNFHPYKVHNSVICIQIISYDEVSQGWDWRDVQKFCGRQLPRQLVLNNANKLRIIFHSNNDVNGDGFSVRKTTHFMKSCDESVTKIVSLLPINFLLIRFSGTQFVEAIMKRKKANLRLRDTQCLIPTHLDVNMRQLRGRRIMWWYNSRLLLTQRPVSCCMTSIFGQFPMFLIS